MKNEEAFLQELEQRLKENRRVAQASVLPKWLWGAASYLGFHTFRTLFIVSFLLTLLSFVWWWQDLIRVSRILFWYQVL